MRQHVSVIFALGNLGVEFERRRMMAPSEDARQIVEPHSVPLRILGGELLRGKEKYGASVGHLGAVPDLDTAGDSLIELALLLRVALAHDPATRLRERIASRVGEVDRGYMREMFVFEPEALVVLVTQPAEQTREGIILALAFALVPSGGTEEVATRYAVDGLHLLESDHCGD